MNHASKSKLGSLSRTAHDECIGVSHVETSYEFVMHHFLFHREVQHVINLCEIPVIDLVYHSTVHKFTM